MSNAWPQACGFNLRLGCYGGGQKLWFREKKKWSKPRLTIILEKCEKECMLSRCREDSHHRHQPLRSSLTAPEWGEDSGGVVV
uniref:Uncharacterized protein n=2 Tax=Oryza TaxID=4527 RepID=A0A0D3HUX6_9ORYZ